MQRFVASVMRPSTAPLVFAVVAAWLAAACAGPGRAGTPRRSATVISTEEIQEMHQAGVRDLYDLVSRQRPRWLDTQSERRLQVENSILVYHNEARLGDVSALRGFPLLSVLSLTYLDAAQATLLPGGGSAHVVAAIVIRTGARPAVSSPPGSPPPPAALRRTYP